MYYYWTPGSHEQMNDKSLVNIELTSRTGTRGDVRVGQQPVEGLVHETAVPSFRPSCLHTHLYRLTYQSSPSGTSTGRGPPPGPTPSDSPPQFPPHGWRKSYHHKRTEMVTLGVQGPWRGKDPLGPVKRWDSPPVLIGPLRSHNRPPDTFDVSVSQLEHPCVVKNGVKHTHWGTRTNK